MTRRGSLFARCSFKLGVARREENCSLVLTLLIFLLLLFLRLSSEGPRRSRGPKSVCDLPERTRPLCVTSRIPCGGGGGERRSQTCSGPRSPLLSIQKLAFISSDDDSSTDISRCHHGASGIGQRNRVRAHHQKLRAAAPLQRRHTEGQHQRENR